MSNDEQRTALAAFVQDVCTYRQEDIDFIHKQYSLLKEFLGGRVFQSGSYARETAINPINDLDVIWILPRDARRDFDTIAREVKTILSDVAITLSKKYAQKSIYVSVKPQEHSILIEFPDKKGDFTIDVVPAVETSEMNGYGAYYFRIPEVGLLKRPQRESMYKKLESEKLPVKWLKTDPKGYIELGKRMNDKHKFYRDVVKVVKKWKHALKMKFNDKERFKLKSFHIEQVIFDLLGSYKYLSPLELLRDFYKKLPDYMKKPYIKDLAQDANNGRYIDSYVADLNEVQKENLLYYAKCAYLLLSNNDLELPEYLYRLISLEENIEANDFLFTSETTRNKQVFQITFVITNEPLSNQYSPTERQRQQITFDVSVVKLPNQEIYWKVRNTGEQALKANQLRGEINIGKTKSYPEKTAYIGDHYVTSYLVDKTTRKIIAYDTVMVTISPTIIGIRPCLQARVK